MTRKNKTIEGVGGIAMIIAIISLIVSVVLAFADNTDDGSLLYISITALAISTIVLIISASIKTD